MGEITINNVRDAVVTVLGEQFPDIEIYGEEIKQGFTEPCFFVKLFPVAQDREFGRRYKRYHAFDIHYFPESETDANEEMHDMAEQLYACLEYIQVNSSLCRGHGMKHEIVDGVLHFFVNYDFHVLKPVPEVPAMQSLEQEGLVK